MKYVTLYRFTEQGAKSIGDTVTRAREAVAAAEKAGGKISTLVWTQGQYDLVAVADWPDESSAMAFLMTLGKAGNVRTETLRAFTSDEMESILKRVP